MQASCLIGGPSPAFMRFFDQLHPEARAMIRESRHNLCLACIEETCSDYRHVPFDTVIRVFEWAIDKGYGAEEVKKVLSNIPQKRSYTYPVDN